MKTLQALPAGWESTEEGFDKLYRLMGRKVLAYAQRRLGDLEAAKDLTQEIFLKLYRFRSSYRAELPFGSWFWALARNATQDWMRSTASQSREEGGQEEVFEQTGAPGPCAETRMARKSWRRELLRSLRPLTRLQKKVLWLRFVHELSHQEIADRLGLSIASVKCLIQRAKGALSIDPELIPSLA